MAYSFAWSATGSRLRTWPWKPSGAYIHGRRAPQITWGLAVPVAANLGLNALRARQRRAGYEHQAGKRRWFSVTILTRLRKPNALSSAAWCKQPWRG